MTSPTSLLSEMISPGRLFARSVNLERDTAAGALDEYLPTARALETLRRVAAAMLDPTLTRAWSITGPYGSGKSSLALLLDVLAGPDDSLRQSALRIVGAVDNETSDTVGAAISQIADSSGLIRAVATAQREPATRTIVRAVLNGLRRYPGTGQRQRSLLKEAERLLEAVPLSARVVADLLEHVASIAPVLLVVDEFGKNLEFFADRVDDADLFVLQEIAERANGPGGLPVYFLTLQHLAFEEYATAASAVQRREWAKVQGRFEDIPFVDSPSELLQLVARVLRRSNSDDGGFAPAIDRWAVTEHKRLSDLPIAERLPTASLLAACYPLHPLALAVLPELCSRYGQRERTLFSFLARPEPHSLASFLAETPVGRRRPPTLGVDRVFDYFISAGATILGSSEGASRWIEIDARIRETQGLTDDEQRVIKTIGVLNLASRGGTLRASRALLEYAFPRLDLDALLGGLESRGLLIHRDFADEYRIWHGSDFDLQGSIDEARRRLVGESVASVCERALPLPPLVAARHSQDKGILRFFERRYAAAGTTIAAPTADDKADGVLVYVVDGTPAGDLRLSAGNSGKPMLLVYPGDPTGLLAAATDAAAVAQVLSANEGLGDDWVARRELHERAALATARFRTVLEAAFGLDLKATKVTMADGSSVQRSGRRTWSAILSDVCDSVYVATPTIANEMLARRELSSQAARARRDLLTAMVEQFGRHQLGITGYGPERAMLESVLVHTGIYRSGAAGKWRFGPPWQSSGYGPTWETIEHCLEEARERRLGLDAIWAALAIAPIGLPDGPIPVLVTAALLSHADDVAIYQDGTFQASFGAELIERLVKTPERFAVKHFATSGPRRRVVAAVTARFGSSGAPSEGRNPTLIHALRPIIRRVRNLPEFAQHTTLIGESARRVREALTSATEPDELLFKALPLAVGIRPFTPAARITEAAVEDFADRVTNAVTELEATYPALLEHVVDALATGVGRPSPASMQDVRSELGLRARGIVDRVLEPRLRSFLLAAGDTALENIDWVENLAMNVAERPAPAWRDIDRRRFDTNVAELLAAYRRVEMLHLEHLDAPAGGVMARQVMVTTPDGHTTGGVVWLDDAAANEIDDILTKALGEAEARVGARAAEALLAALAEKVVGSATAKPVPLRAGAAPQVGDYGEERRIGG
jgi:hypothetical protein